MKRSLQQQEYIARINRAMDFIQSNLDRPLQLKDVAEAAHFSPFHFHRIFRGVVGETLGGYIQRLRVKKAASLLITNPKASITDVALDCGFSTSASFARVFRSHYGMSAGREVCRGTVRDYAGSVSAGLGLRIYNLASRQRLPTRRSPTVRTVPQ